MKTLASASAFTSQLRTVQPARSPNVTKLRPPPAPVRIDSFVGPEVARAETALRSAGSRISASTLLPAAVQAFEAQVHEQHFNGISEQQSGCAITRTEFSALVLSFNMLSDGHRSLALDRLGSIDPALQVALSSIPRPASLSDRNSAYELYTLACAAHSGHHHG